MKTCGRVRREECSQRCSQGCWAGRRHRAKPGGWLFARSSVGLWTAGGVSCRTSSRYTNVAVHKALHLPALCSYVRSHTCSASISFSLSVRPLFSSAFTSRNIDSAPRSPGFKVWEAFGSSALPFFFIADQSLGFSAGRSQQTANVQLA